MRIYTATSTTHELRKVWRNDKDGPKQDETNEGFRFAKDFIYEDHDVGTLTGLCDLLNYLSDVPQASLVLGQPLIERGGRTGLDFADDATNLCVVDLDSLEYDGTAEEAVRFAFPFLNGRQFVYAFSPSSGFKAGHRLRVKTAGKRVVTASKTGCSCMTRPHLCQMLFTARRSRLPRTMQRQS